MRARAMLVGVALGGVALVVVVSASPQVRAGPPPAVTARDAAAVRAAGDQITLAARSLDGVALLEPLSAGSRLAAPAAVAPDGLTLAFTPVGRGLPGPLVLASGDGAQLDVALPGLSGAAFSPTGEWLAVVDLAGALWRVEAATGAASRLSDGPFGPDPTVLPDGRVLVVRLSSLEAPVWAAAQLVALDGTVTEIDAGMAAEDQLVYAAAALIDEAVVMVRHRTGGGVVVLRVADGATSTMATLEAASVAVSPTGERLAWIADGGVWLDRPDASDPFDLGPGRAARFSPDGSLLLVLGERGASVFDLGATFRSAAAASACWFGDGRGCRP